MKKTFFVLVATLISSSAMAKEMYPYHLLSCERLIDHMMDTETRMEKMEGALRSTTLSEGVRKTMQTRVQEMASEYEQLVVAANRVCR